MDRGTNIPKALFRTAQSFLAKKDTIIRPSRTHTKMGSFLWIKFYVLSLGISNCTLLVAAFGGHKIVYDITMPMRRTPHYDDSLCDPHSFQSSHTSLMFRRSDWHSEEPATAMSDDMSDVVEKEELVSPLHKTREAKKRRHFLMYWDPPKSLLRDKRRKSTRDNSPESKNTDQENIAREILAEDSANSFRKAKPQQLMEIPEVKQEVEFGTWASKGLGNWPFTTTRKKAPEDMRRSLVNKSVSEESILETVSSSLLLEHDDNPYSARSSSKLVNIGAFLQSTRNVTLLKQMTDRVDDLLSVPLQLPDLVYKAAEIVSNTSTSYTETAVKETQEYATRLLEVTENLLSKGYVNGDPLAGKETEILDNVHHKDIEEKGSLKGRKRALFDSFGISAVELNDWTPTLETMYQMSEMASIIYAEDYVAQLLANGESIVATQVTGNVRWSISDSLVSSDGRKPHLQRTVTIRGYDASDSDPAVDRYELLNSICCKAQPIELKGVNGQKILVHKGLYETAQELYVSMKPYLVDWLSHSNTKVVLSGHSIGGALSNLLLFLITLDQGTEFVQDRIQRVYTFGAPPVAALMPSSKQSPCKVLTKEGVFTCDVLEAFGLPSNIVEGYVQPWDPISRLFSSCDPLYPLIGDIDMEKGDDGLVLWPRGPPRVLRQVTSAIIDAWGDGWPEFRDAFHKNSNQTYISVGVQHLLLPEPTRYLTDRFITVDIAVPPVQTILQLSSRDLLPALTKAFPLDTFEISYVPQAIRSFVHHFFPAYSASLVDYRKRLLTTREKRIPRDVESTSLLVEEDYDSTVDEETDDSPCFILDTSSEEAATMLVKAIQNNPSLSPLTQELAKEMVAKTFQEDQENIRPWKRAANWFRRRGDPSP